VLGSGRSSRLYQRVREGKNLILGSSILDTTGHDPGYLVVEFAAEPAKADAALAEVMAQILRFQVEPPSAAELERALGMHQGKHCTPRNDGRAGVDPQAHYAARDYQLASTTLERLARVDAARVQDVASYLNLSEPRCTCTPERTARSRPQRRSATSCVRRWRGVGASSRDNGNCAPSVLPVGSGTGRGCRRG
jgi:predicted Zn-dependent peptidase